MIGIVLVSHSRALADAVLEMAGQLGGGQGVRLAAAAGVGPDRQVLGTDAAEVAQAIESVFAPDGVLVLMDLGSAVLSAELALELLPPQVGARVRFCSGPLVEGAIAAVVQAGLGSDLETVWQEARQALRPKQAQLGEAAFSEASFQPDSRESAFGEAPDSQPREEAVVKLHNAHGLHARPAARFVRLSATFASTLTVTDLTHGRGPAPARSLNALVALGAARGHLLKLEARGPDATQAIAALSRLIEENFGERAATALPEKAAAEPAAPGEKSALPPTAVAITPVSAGIAIGPLYHYRPPRPAVSDAPAADPEFEWQNLVQARQQAGRELERLEAPTQTRPEEALGAIFAAHRLLLDDPALLDPARAAIFDGHLNAAQAWQASLEQAASQLATLEDPYLRQRAADLRDVGDRVLRALAGERPAALPELPGPVILLGREFSPSEVAAFDAHRVLGLVTLSGGPTSHNAILARSLGVPALTGAPASLLDLPDGALLALDGKRGLLWVQPEEATRLALEALQGEEEAHRRRLLQTSQEPGQTRDGRLVEVVANIGSVKEASIARAAGAEGVGVLRTEFLYLTRREPPSEDEQVQALEQIAAALEGRPVIVRTLDVGGDKALPYLDLPLEANPFLGVRAIRLSLRRPELFQTQLRAVLRAGTRGNLRLLLPMVTELDELLAAKAQLEAAHTALLVGGVEHAWPVQTGIMIEVPAAALAAEVLAPHTDFFSIGTNDLTQYTLAAERGNAALAGFADALHPSILKLIQMVAEAAHAHRKWAGACGEIAGDPLAAPALVGLGADELSLNPAGIPQVKAALRRFTFAEAQALADEMLRAESSAAARRLAEAFAHEHADPAD